MTTLRTHWTPTPNGPELIEEPMTDTPNFEARITAADTRLADCRRDIDETRPDSLAEVREFDGVERQMLVEIAASTLHTLVDGVVDGITPGSGADQAHAAIDAALAAVLVVIGEGE